MTQLVVDSDVELLTKLNIYSAAVSTCSTHHEHHADCHLFPGSRPQY